MLVSPEALPDGWSFDKHSDKYCVWFDEQGKCYKSSKEMETALRKSGPLGTEEDSKTEAKASEYSLKHRMILVGKENVAYLYSKGVEREHCIVA